MGLLKGIFTILGLLVLAIVGLGAFLYFTDYEAKGTITEKGSDGQGSYVVIRPAFVPYDITQRLDSNAAQFVCEGYAVAFRIQSQHYEVRDREGDLVYDSDTGLAADPIELTRCAALG